MVLQLIDGQMTGQPVVINVPRQRGIYSPEKTSAAGPVMKTSF